MASNAQVADPHKIYGQTIAIKHYLNKRVKPETVVRNGKKFEAYPVYVQITVKKQNTQLRSVIEDYVIPEYFTEFLAENFSVINNEIQIIRDRILEYLPFESSYFVLKYSLDGFNVKEKDIRFVFLEYLWYEFQQAFIDDYIFRAKQGYPSPQLFFGFNEDEEISYNELKEAEWRVEASCMIFKERVKEGLTQLALQVSYYADDAHPNLLALWNRYEINLWKLEDYCKGIEMTTGHSIITLSDWINGKFDELFIKAGYTLNALLSIKRSFETLRTEHDQLDIIVKNISM